MLAPPPPRPSLLKRVADAIMPRPPAARPFTEMGVGGTAHYGGYIVTKERSSQWVGAQRYTTISDMAVNASIVAAGVHYFLNLIAHPRWTMEPADDSAAAQAAAELVDECLQDLTQPWSRVVRRAGTYRFYGFGVQEWTAKRRRDGRVGLASIEARPQATVERWSIADDGEVLGVWQRSPHTGQELGLPRRKILYLVDDVLTDSPEGVGIFRHLAEPWERLKQYYALEARAFERDLRGTPIGRIPYTLLREAVANGELTEAQARAQIEAMESFIKLQVKQSDTGMSLDSVQYYSQAADGSKVTGVPQWGIELLQGGSAGMGEVAAAIVRTQTEMARLLTCEHLMMGESSGNRALGEDKSRNLYLVSNAVLRDIVAGVRQDVVPALCDLNGIPEELRPVPKAEDVAFKDADSVAGTLARMATAGAVLAPNDPVIEDVRSLLGVSPPAPVTPEMMGLATGEEDGAEETGGEEDEPGEEEEGEVKKAFDPNQPRDDDGKWRDTGFASGARGSVIAYHGTREKHLDAIMSDGITASRDRRKFDSDYYRGARGEAVFVASKAEDAIFYATNRFGDLRGRGVVIKLQIPAKEFAKFKRDHLHEPDELGGFVGEARYAKMTIPPKWIKNFYEVKGGKIKEVDKQEGGGVAWLCVVLPDDTEISKDYDPNQPRDDLGRWSHEGGVAIQSPSWRTRMAERAASALDVVRGTAAAATELAHITDEMVSSTRTIRSTVDRVRRGEVGGAVDVVDTLLSAVDAGTNLIRRARDIGAAVSRAAATLRGEVAASQVAVDDDDDDDDDDDYDKAFDPSQPRDDDGKWSETGAGGVSGAGSSEPSSGVKAALRTWTQGQGLGGAKLSTEQRSAISEWAKKQPGAPYEVYRGEWASLKDLTNGKFSVGDEVTFNEVRSFTADKIRTGAYGSGGDFHIRYILPAGEAVNIAPWSVYPQEQEHIIPESRTYRIASRKRPNPGQFDLYLERVVEKGFDPSQPRDEDGKWTDTGAGVTGMGDIRPPRENISELLEANFTAGEVVGNEVASIDSLRGGVSSDPNESKRVRGLVDAISSSDGYFERIVVDDEDNVVEGQHRLDAARALGVREVPILRVREKMRGIDVAAAVEAVRSIQAIRLENARQIVENAVDIVRESGTVDAALSDYEFPRGFESQYKAAIRAVGAAALRGVEKAFDPSQPRTLYVRRRLLNAGALRAWAASQGIASALPAGDMHATVAFSKEPVDWSSLEPMRDAIVVLDDSVSKGFDPSQPRDDDGKWTDDGGGGPTISSLVGDYKEDKYREIGKINVEAWRVGKLEGERGIHFGDSLESVEPYATIHEGESPQRYSISAQNVILARSQFALHKQLFNGKTFQDAIWEADKKSGFKSSIEAAKQVEIKMARRLRSLGYDAVIYAAPPAPAKHELVIINPKKASISVVKLDATVGAPLVKRAVHQFPPRTTPNGALVLKFESPELAARWRAFRDAGASWDFPGYQPHVTITYSVPEADVGAIEPYRGPLIFGPEEFSEVSEDWANEITEEPLAKGDPDQPREPAGSPAGGQWTDEGGGGGDVAGAPLNSEFVAVSQELGLGTSYAGSDAPTRMAGFIVDNPLPRTAAVTYQQVSTIPLHFLSMSGGEEGTAKISGLKAAQDYVFPARVKQYVSKDPDAFLSKGGVIVAEIKGDQVVVDGVHRVLAAKLSSDATIKIRHIGKFKIKDGELSPEAHRKSVPRRPSRRMSEE